MQSLPVEMLLLKKMEKAANQKNPQTNTVTTKQSWSSQVQQIY